jgi:hypothetical protein
MKNCHASQPNKISGAKTEANSRVTDTRNHRMSICYEALLNASPSHDFNKTIILYSAATNIPTLEINRVSGFSSSFIKEHHPPDLFLSNSSLLL